MRLLSREIRSLLAVSAAVLAVPSSAAGGPWTDLARARAGLERAVGAGRVAEIDAPVYRRDLAAASAQLLRLAPARRGALSAALADLAVQSPRYTHARARTLFATLRVNTALLRGVPLPRDGRDVHDAVGLAYRVGASGAARFHPLASFGRLNAELRAGRYRRAARLAYTLLAHAQERRGALVWEYYYRAAGGRPPWTSGLVQAVAAQALARVGLLREARAAYRAIPRALVVPTRYGPWIRLYSFSRAAVLNAQLQAALSLREYAGLAGDRGAALLAARLRSAAAAALPSFDTGSWSLYALGGVEAPLRYHTYVTQLLWRLATAHGDQPWTMFASRFRDYWRGPPDIRPGRAWRSAIPLPADGFRDEAWVTFWLSKPATVTLRVDGDVVTARAGAGLRWIAWSPGPRRPGSYSASLTAVDRVGNRTTRPLPALRVERDTTPPRLEAAVAGTDLRWRAVDRGTPWLRLGLLLDDGRVRRAAPLGRVRLAGSAPLPVDLRRTWSATLVAVDSSGNRTQLALGPIGRLARLPR